jgi:predicted nucleic acid-binding protein
LNEVHSAAVSRFFESLSDRDRLFGPCLIFDECTSTIREKAYRKVINTEEADSALDVALSLPITTVVDADHHKLALVYAARRNKIKAYDEHYIAVAAVTRSQLVTFDAGMYQSAVDLTVPARLVQ